MQHLMQKSKLSRHSSSIGEQNSTMVIASESVVLACARKARKPAPASSCVSLLIEVQADNDEIRRSLRRRPWLLTDP